MREILDYFDGPGQPDKYLLNLQRDIEDGWCDDNCLVATIPLEAYAWLDLVVRDEAVDEALGVENVWSVDKIKIDLEQIRRRKLAEFIARYSSTPPAVNQRKMAPSFSTRGSSGEREKTA